MKTVKSVQGDTIDLICWRYDGRTAGVTETVLESNPALAKQGPILVLGTEVVLPDIPAQQQMTKTINLWD